MLWDENRVFMFYRELKDYYIYQIINFEFLLMREMIIGLSKTFVLICLYSDNILCSYSCYLLPIPTCDFLETGLVCLVFERVTFGSWVRTMIRYTAPWQAKPHRPKRKGLGEEKSLPHPAFVSLSVFNSFDPSFLQN